MHVVQYELPQTAISPGALLVVTLAKQCPGPRPFEPFELTVSSVSGRSPHGEAIMVASPGLAYHKHVGAGSFGLKKLRAPYPVLPLLPL